LAFLRGQDPGGGEAADRWNGTKHGGAQGSTAQHTALIEVYADSVHECNLLVVDRERRNTDGVSIDDGPRARPSPVNPHERLPFTKEPPPSQFGDGNAPRRNGHRQVLDITKARQPRAGRRGDFRFALRYV